jgi:PAS domain S-box-containing protein
VQEQYVGYCYSHHGWQSTRRHVFAGQFFFDDEPLDLEIFRSQAKKYGFNEEEYITALDKVPRLSREAVETGMSFFMAFANMLSQLSYSNNMLAKSLDERDALVDAIRKSEKKERARSNELAVVLDAVPAFMLITHDTKALKMTGNRISHEWLQLPTNVNLSKAAPEGERPDNYALFKDGVEIPLADMPVRLSASSGEELREYEFDIVYKDGTIRHLLGNAIPLRDNLGNPSGAVAAFIDITERKKSEEKLRESEEKHRNIVETSQEGIWLIDHNDQTIFVNQKVSEMLGYSINEILGQSPQKFLAPEFRLVADNYLREHRHRVNTVRDYRFIRKDESDLWCILSARQLLDAKGKHSGSLGMLTDITERKQAERALKESETRFRALAENSPDIITRFDRGYRHLYANPAAVESYDLYLDEFIGITQGELGRDTNKVKYWESRLEKIFVTGKNETLEYYISRQGKKHYFNTKIVPELA